MFDRLCRSSWRRSFANCAPGLMLWRSNKSGSVPTWRSASTLLTNASTLLTNASTLLTPGSTRSIHGLKNSKTSFPICATNSLRKSAAPPPSTTSRSGSPSSKPNGNRHISLAQQHVVRHRAGIIGHGLFCPATLPAGNADLANCLPGIRENPHDPWFTCLLRYFHFLRLRRAEANRFGQQNGFDAAQGAEHRLADLAVHLHHRDGRALLPMPRAAKREVGDVDVMLPEHCPDAAHNTGHVQIAQVDDVAFQRRFHMNAIDFQQPG